jgi:sodium/pantothenate symporter
MTDIASSQMVTAGWVLILIYSAAVLFFVVRGARATRTMSDYAVGSLAFSPVVVGMSLAASMMSAATFIINPGLIAVYGVSGVLSYAVVLPIGCLISLVILTKGFRKYGTVVKATTMAQWMGSRFESPGYSLFFGVLALLLITFIVLICVGLTKVLSKTLNIQELYVLIGVVVFIFGYMMFGGANSMVYTNSIQAALMLLVAFILLGSGHEHFSDGVQGFFSKLAAIDPNLARATNPESYLFRDTFEIVACQLVIGVAIVCQPHIITKSLLLKSDRDVNRYLVVSVVVCLIFFMVVIVGLFARLAFPDLTVNGTKLMVDGVVSAYVVKEFTVYVGIVVVMGLIAAGISTLEGLIQSVSATITADLIDPIRRFVNRSSTEAAPSSVGVNRLVIGVLGAISAVLTYRQLVAPDLSVAIFAQNGVYAYFAAAFFPVLAGTFGKRISKHGPIVASVTAVAVHFAMYYGELIHYMQAKVKNPGIAGAIAIVASLVVGLSIVWAKRGRSAQSS